MGTFIKLFEDYVEFLQSNLILEGGAAGHMSHPFDDMDLTFGDFKKLIISGLSGNLSFESEPTEKTDGQNLWATIKDGEVKFARNKGESIDPMSLDNFINKFKDHPVEGVRDTFTFAAKDLAKLLIKLPKDVQDSTFENGLNFINMELIYSGNMNIINYDRDVIQFHNLTKTDGKGNVIDVDLNVVKEVEKALTTLESTMGDVFKLIPPQVIKLHKDVDFDQNQDKFLNKLKTIQSEYNLNDNDKIMEYHKRKWRDIVDSEFKDIDDYTKDCLVLRWAFGDKKSINIKEVYKKYPDEKDHIKTFEDSDVKKKLKENIRPFEDLFLSLGALILKNAENFVVANPTDEADRLKQMLKDEVSKIKSSDNEDAINKMLRELERLESIGGIENIYPTEGIVFRYNGKLYKLTGTFAPLNQLLGILKYNR